MPRTFVPGKTQIHVWTHEGWITKDAEKDDIQQLNYIRQRIPYEQPDFSRKSKCDDISLLEQIQEGIQIGSAFDKIDRLPNMLRMMFEAPDVWYVTKGNLFKIVDPITQAKVNGEWGIDLTNADSVKKSIARSFLEMEGIASFDDEDLMEDMITTQDAEVHTSKNYRSKGSINWMSEEDEEDEDSSEFYKDPVAVLELSKESEEIFQAAKQRYKDRLEVSNTEQEKELALLMFEQELDHNKSFSNELVLRMDSPFFSDGYQQPRRRYEFIFIDQESDISIAAQDRERLFSDLFAEAGFCKTKADLLGPINSNGQRDYNKGFYGQIRPMYQHDKDLNSKWSLKDREDKDGNLIESAFNKDRKAYILKWRDENRGDEESLRSSVWYLFDRVQEETSAQYENGKLIKGRKNYKDSVWRQKRTQALCELNLTVAQWTSVYALLARVNKRIELNYKTSEEEQKTITLLGKYFKLIETLEDLRAYRRWAERRRWIYKKVILKEWRDEFGIQRSSWKRVNTYKFIPSKLDCLSIVNTGRWWKSLMKKEHQLIQEKRKEKENESSNKTL